MAGNEKCLVVPLSGTAMPLSPLLLVRRVCDAADLDDSREARREGSGEAVSERLPGTVGVRDERLCPVDGKGGEPRAANLGELECEMADGRSPSAMACKPRAFSSASAHSAAGAACRYCRTKPRCTLMGT